jgi:hypothetical protein
MPSIARNLDIMRLSLRRVAAGPIPQRSIHLILSCNAERDRKDPFMHCHVA